MAHENLDYVQRLRSKGYRVTFQRLIVLDAVCEVGGHATFGEIRRRAREIDPTISQSTIYRALDVLCEVGLVSESEMGEAGKIYKIVGESPHHHLVCSSCGAVFAFDSQIILPALKRIHDEYDFSVRANHLVLYGLCGNCHEE